MGVNRFSDQRIWPLKAYGLADFENTGDRGSAVIFDMDSRFCLSYAQILGSKRNLDQYPSSALVGMLLSSSKLFLFSKELRCETVIMMIFGVVLCYSHQACYLL